MGWYEDQRAVEMVEIWNARAALRGAFADNRWERWAEQQHLAQAEHAKTTTEPAKGLAHFLREAKRRAQRGEPCPLQPEPPRREIHGVWAPPEED